MCYSIFVSSFFFFFFFNDTATTEIYTLSLHDALPISGGSHVCATPRVGRLQAGAYEPVRRPPDPSPNGKPALGDRKSTRLNSSHSQISYAVFCLKKKKQNINNKNQAIIIPEHNTIIIA